MPYCSHLWNSDSLTTPLNKCFWRMDLRVGFSRRSAHCFRSPTPCRLQCLLLQRQKLLSGCSSQAAAHRVWAVRHRRTRARRLASCVCAPRSTRAGRPSRKPMAGPRDPPQTPVCRLASHCAQVHCVEGGASSILLGEFCIIVWQKVRYSKGTVSNQALVYNTESNIAHNFKFKFNF